METKEILARVDHTLLKPTATWEQIATLCTEAIAYQMASVCIPPSFVKRAAGTYGDTLPICTVIGFPLGYSTTATKVNEVADAIANGASEVDMVVNLGDVKDGRFELVTAEIKALKAAAGERILKVIVETCYLTDAEKIALCHCVSEAGADFIKTSTGFGSGGATLDDVALFKKHIGPGVKIKAAGGIRTREDFAAYANAGCARIGASAAVQAFHDDLLGQDAGDAEINADY